MAAPVLFELKCIAALKAGSKTNKAVCNKQPYAAVLLQDRTQVRNAIKPVCDQERPLNCECRPYGKAGMQHPQLLLLAAGSIAIR